MSAKSPGGFGKKQSKSFREPIRKPTVILTIEHKEREFLSKMLIATALVAEGFRVYVGSSESADVLARKLDPSIFFHKSTHPRSITYKKWGHLFCFLDEEGGVTTPRSTIEAFCHWRYATLAPERQDLVFLPNEEWRRVVKSMPNSAGVRLEVSGWPRIDLWRSEFSPLFEAAAKEIKDRFGRFVLIPTSFGASTEKGFDYLIRSAPDEHFQKIQEHKKRAFRDYADLIRELDRSLPVGVSIIVRPHPSESKSDWESLVQGLERTHVIREGDITPWILASESLIQFGSTTVTQAVLAGKLCVQYRVKKMQGVTDSPSFDLAVDASTPHEVVALLSGPVNGEAPSYRDTQKVLLESAGYDPSTLAVVKIVRVLKGASLPPVGQASLTSSDLLRLEMIHWGSFIKYQMQRMGMLRANLKTVYENIPNGVGETEAQDVIQSLSSILKLDLSGVSAQAVGRNLISLG